MKNKLKSLLGNLNQGLIAREQTVKLALLTLLAGENILLVGPPGTGKSYIARRMADSLAGDDEQGSDYFEYLLTKFSTPEEIFGPLSISELKQDRFKRNTTGYLPTVKTAFLDEIFKSSSSILNALLTILNERVYHNGAEVQPVPLRALIAASNELPTEQTELSALYDRFLVRVFVDYVPEHQREHFFRPFEVFEPQPSLCITDAELAQIATAAAQVEIPAEVAQAIQQIWIKHKDAFKEDRRESLSDRRLVKVIQLLRVSAVTNGRTKMDLSDVLLLKDCLWSHQDNAEQVMGIVQEELNAIAMDIVEKNLKPLVEIPPQKAKGTVISKSILPMGFGTSVWGLGSGHLHLSVAERNKIEEQEKEQKALDKLHKQKLKNLAQEKKARAHLKNQKSTELLTGQLQANIWM